MRRILLFLAILIVPLIFSWWLFIPLALLLVFLAKMPLELVLAGFMLDMIYYFGEGFFYDHLLTLLAVLLLAIAFSIDKAVRWPKRI